MTRTANEAYTKRHLEQFAFPLGGMGAGMICLSGNGGFQDANFWHKPAMGERLEQFSALSIKQEDGRLTRVLEGPVQERLFAYNSSGRKHGYLGLPGFAQSSITAQFPFATMSLSDDEIPVTVALQAWSPFIPSDEDASSLPVASLEYKFTNTSDAVVEMVYSFNARNPVMKHRNWSQSADDLGPSRVRKMVNGLIFEQDASAETPWDEGRFCVQIASHEAAVNPAWFRGNWFDPQSMAWNAVEQGLVEDTEEITEGKASPGGTLAVPLCLEPGASTTVKVLFSWYVPYSDVAFSHGEQQGPCCEGACAPDTTQKYQPWYAGRFSGIEDLSKYWLAEQQQLRRRSAVFRDHLFASDLPPASLEAIAANLSILKSPTVLRQQDGRLWAWEGCSAQNGCCPGSCTHVWNYAQAIPHLFPRLERGLRETELNEASSVTGKQLFRTPLPIHKQESALKDEGGRGIPAADGQLGGIIKVYRDWRISGDTDWLRTLWAPLKASIKYCIELWDPAHEGVLREPHHNTYDIEFWGADGMCTSFYLAALRAMELMAPAVGDDATEWNILLEAGQQRMENDLYNGDFFIQNIEYEGLRAPNPAEAQTLCADYSPEARVLLEKEGPKYQYGIGCLSDGILGFWLAACAGFDAPCDTEKLTSHLRSIYTHNFKTTMRNHANPQRHDYAMDDEGGLLLCTWPNGSKPSLPFVYSDEVWTGIEYQVASHLIMTGHVEEGEKIVTACRQRYDGRRRNPFDEVECGHYYVRALASYALLQAHSGIRYDAVEKTLIISKQHNGTSRFFFAADDAWGSIHLENGTVSIDMAEGELDVQNIIYAD